MAPTSAENKEKANEIADPFNEFATRIRERNGKKKNKKKRKIMPNNLNTSFDMEQKRRKRERERSVMKNDGRKCTATIQIKWNTELFRFVVLYLSHLLDSLFGHGI